MFRGQRITRMLLEKEEMDHRLLASDHSEWYCIERTAITPYMLNKFHQFCIDDSMEKFLQNSLETSNSICLQVYYALVTSMLSIALTKTSINGILGRGGMHLFSLTQLRKFLDIPPEWVSYDKKLLDLGAGDGRITATMARLYGTVSVTEASKVMEWRLKQYGFTIVPMDTWHQSGTYHLVSALNLLDRHHSPTLLLDQLHSLTLRSNSLLLLAVVLPLHQYVEFHPTERTNQPDIHSYFFPDTKILVNGETFEEQAGSLVVDVLEPAGFELVKWSKLPYLSEGDFGGPVYHLDDAVFLLKPKNTSSTGSIFSALSSQNSIFSRDFTSL
uniref:DREV methyltransferase n=1 Tax=Setaria digitata TaxID=48799 RepID=A0A915PPK1_9BILA